MCLLVLAGLTAVAWAFGQMSASRAVIWPKPRTVASLDAHRERYAKLPPTEWTELGFVFTTDAGKPITPRIAVVACAG